MAARKKKKDKGTGDMQARDWQGKGADRWKGNGKE